MNVVDAFLQAYEQAAKTCNLRTMTQIRRYAYGTAIESVPEARELIDSWKKQMGEHRQAVTPEELSGGEITTGMGRIMKAIKRNGVQRQPIGEFTSDNGHGKPTESALDDSDDDRRTSYRDRYIDYCAHNDYVPSDTILANLTGKNRTLFSGIRSGMKNGGWEFNKSPHPYDGWIVIRRPTQPQARNGNGPINPAPVDLATVMASMSREQIIDILLKSLSK